MGWHKYRILAQKKQFQKWACLAAIFAVALVLLEGRTAPAIGAAAPRGIVLVTRDKVFRQWVRMNVGFHPLTRNHHRKMSIPLRDTFGVFVGDASAEGVASRWKRLERQVTLQCNARDP